jgi:glycosyltransferase involved in cell wall biosynthesis
MEPLVTCVCVTRNRREWLPKAIACFLEQTYEPRELLILADGDPVRDLIPKTDLTIRLSQFPERLSVGQKRNSGVAMAHGKIIAHWDDDDYSAPGRLKDQILRLAASGKAVTAYRSMKFWDGENWWFYPGTPVTGIGSSLCYLREWALNHQFPDQQVGEDNRFVMAAIDEYQFITAPAGDLMYATIHESNTSKRNLAGYELISEPLPDEVCALWPEAITKL